MLNKIDRNSSRKMTIEYNLPNLLAICYFLLALVFLIARAQQQLPPSMLHPPVGSFVPIGPMSSPITPMITVAGSEPLLRQAGRVDEIIWPYENFNSTNPEIMLQNSYVIDHKRFVEPYATRCMSSTLLEDPDAYEPGFIIIRPNSEHRINATSPEEAIQMAGFEPGKRTSLFVHGFTQSYPSTDWLRKIRALFERNAHVGEQNLIIMDWNSHGSYSQVAARVSAMGSFLANFLMKLIDLGADRMSFHLIGHSLGAHVIGFAGKRMRPRKLGRVTALDPAGPCFGKLFSNSPTDRLSADDAHEVDVYHYDDKFLGLGGQHGQWDIFVNGGSSQPGATDNVNAMFQALITMVFRRNRVLSESHTRSTEVCTSQLAMSGCQQIAYECLDWPAFLNGECGQCDESNSQCFFMGFSFQYERMPPTPLRQQFPPKRLYIATSPNDNFCLQHYQLLVRFEPSSELAQMARRQRWKIHIELNNNRGERSNVSLTNQLAPNVFSYLFLSEQAPARFTSALIQVRSSIDNSIIPLRSTQKMRGHTGAAQPPIKVLSLEINFMSDIDWRNRAALSSRLCPVGFVPSFVARRAHGASVADSINLISLDSNDDWLGLDECNK